MGVLPQSRASGATSDGTVVVVNECMKRGRGGGGGGVSYNDNDIYIIGLQ